MEHSKRLILASQSPRRKELLGALGLDFEVRIREINEDFPTEFTPLEAVRHISKNKALAFQDLCEADPNLVVLSADTVVVLDRQVIGKPKDFEEAFDTISRLSDKEHEVITAFALLEGKELSCYHETTQVRFRRLTEDEIRHYICRYRPYDKAGAYGIQEWIGLIGMEYIRGSYSNVVGLPTASVYQALRDKGFSLKAFTI